MLYVASGIYRTTSVSSYAERGGTRRILLTIQGNSITEFALADFRISVNGKILDASTRVGGAISGAALWLYLPERGRFVLSLVPNPGLGFRRGGGSFRQIADVFGWAGTVPDPQRPSDRSG